MFMTWKVMGTVSPTLTEEENRGMTNSMLAGCRISNIAEPLEDRFNVLLLSYLKEKLMGYFPEGMAGSVEKCRVSSTSPPLSIFSMGKILLSSSKSI